MKKIPIFVGLVVVGMASGCLEYPKGTSDSFSGSLFRYHFVGVAALAQNTNAAKLKMIAGLPSTGELREQTLGKLARTPYEVWKKELPPEISDRAELLRPLLDDLLSAETFFEARGPTNQAESVLALQLSEERARLWQTNLWQLMVAWKLGGPKESISEGFKGWELKRPRDANLFQFVRAGKWVFFAAGPDKTSRLPALLQHVKRTGRPVEALEKSLLELDADCPRLSGWLLVFAKYRLPHTRLVVTGRGGSLRTEAQLSYSNPLPYKHEPWRIPTNTVTDPLVSFTVGRGIAPLLKQVKGVPELGLNELPNQFCLWGQSHSLETLASIPIANPTNVLATIAPRMAAFVKMYMPDSTGDFALNTNTSELLWHGLPFIQPYFQPAKESGVDYLHGGLLRFPKTTNPPPADLYTQFFGRTDLIYYDWELTGQRLLHVRTLYRLFDIINRRQLPGTNALSEKWLLETAPHLSNTASEVTMKSPKELAVVRKSDIGFTGYELVTLTRWLDSPGFPLAFEGPPSMKSVISALKASRTNSAAAARTNLPSTRRTNSPPGTRP